MAIGAEPSDFVALDLETTGLSPRDDRIVEVGAVRFAPDGRTIATFERLVNPLRPSGARARAVHGISDAELALAQTAQAVLPEFLEFLGEPGGTTLLAHNAAFDAGFLGAELARAGLAMPGHDVLDTLAIARSRVPGLPSHRLDLLSRHFDLDPTGPHRALADSHRVKGLWLALEALGPADPSRPHPAYPIHDPGGPVPAPRGWAPLAEAATRGWTVRLVYEGGTRGASPREVTPRRFAHRGGAAYVVSLCHIDLKEKEFRLDRVRSYEVLRPEAPARKPDCQGEARGIC